MRITKIFGILLFLAGFAMIYYGYSTSQTSIEQLEMKQHASFSDLVIFNILGGGLCVVIGMILVVKNRL